MPTLSKTRRFILTAFVLLQLMLTAFKSCEAQSLSCSDPDSSFTQAETSTYKKSETVLTDSGKIVSRYTDSCDYMGVMLTEYSCQKNSIGRSVRECLFGCLNGACVAPKDSSNGCFSKIDLGITQSPVDSKWSLKVLKFQQEIDRLWYAAARTANLKNGDEDLRISVRNLANSEIAVYYADAFPAVYRDNKKSPDIEPLASEIVLPFNPRANSLVFEFLGSRLTLTLPPEAKRCAKPCISSPRAAGIEGEDTCCPNFTKTPVNSKTFVCSSLPMATPTPKH